MIVKQVIVIRKDLKMQRGKEIAQGAHASMAFVQNRLKVLEDVFADRSRVLEGIFSPAQVEWLTNGLFTKVTVQVANEDELLKVYAAARGAGLEAYMIEDSGKTVFHGQPTRTCLAIGPDHEEKIDPITKRLLLY